MTPKVATNRGLPRPWAAEAPFVGALGILALLMTLKYFPGLENPAAYAGNVFQAIYPDAFPNDPYIKPGRLIWEKSLQLSLLYLPPKLMGEIWLDDRFNAFVYLSLVFVSLVGIDRIVSLGGIHELVPRLAIQLVFLRDHQILNNKVFFAHQPDFNHVSFAIPVAIWLFYVTIAKKKLWVILLLCVLLTLASIRNAPIVIAMSLIIAAINGGTRDRLIVAGLFVAALIVFTVAVVYVFPVPEHDRLALWDTLYESLVPSQVNPFAPERTVPLTVLWNATFVGLCLAALLAPGPHTEGMKGLRLYVGLGLAVWLLAGLYFSFAPDFLKIPQTLPFTPVRILRWPQTLAYVAIMVGLFHALRENRSVAGAAVAATVIGILLVLGPENYWQWATLFLASACGAAAWSFLRARADALGRQGTATPSPAIAIAQRAPVLLMQALLLTVGIAYAATIWARSPAWQTWAKTGVMGDSGSARWIGVAEYIRGNTPPDAAVLPLEYNRQNPGQLIATRYIATRSGRSTPVINELYSLYSLPGYQTEFQQRELMQRIQTAFQERRWAEAAVLLPDLLLVPDYILIPSEFVDASNGNVQPFAELTRVKGYAILRHHK